MKAAALYLLLTLVPFLANSVFAQSVSNEERSSDPKAQNAGLSIGTDDLRIESSNDGGYMLYVRQKPGIQSILLTESTEDPAHKVASYALRSKTYNTTNGGEKRKLDGKFLSGKDMFFLVSSTPSDDPVFGKAFRIFMPYVLVYGYPSGRYGELQLLDGTYLSVRSFSLPYADYSGAFRDNPFNMRITQVKSGPTSTYNREAVVAFSNYATESGGLASYVPDASGLVDSLAAFLGSIKDSKVDLALCLDATKSFEDEAPAIQTKVLPLITTFISTHPGSKVSVIQFRDYLEDFLYKMTPLTDDSDVLDEALQSFNADGGRDIPEAVDEAVYAALTELAWSNPKKLVLLVGDAPPHPIARGSVSASMVQTEAASRSIQIDTLLLPF